MTSWPRHKVDAIRCREKDLVIRIADWTQDVDEPGYDVECYIKGVYDWNESKILKTKKQAIRFAQAQIKKWMG